jgi:hypothetical protein
MAVGGGEEIAGAGIREDGGAGARSTGNKVDVGVGLGLAIPTTRQLGLVDGKLISVAAWAQPPPRTRRTPSRTSAREGTRDSLRRPWPSNLKGRRQDQLARRARTPTSRHPDSCGMEGALSRCDKLGLPPLLPGSHRQPPPSQSGLEATTTFCHDSALLRNDVHPPSGHPGGGS